MSKISQPSVELKQLLTLIDQYANAQMPAAKLHNRLHKLRIKTRKLIALSPPESYQTLLFKRVLQCSNQLRDIDVFSREILPSFPNKWQAALHPIYIAMQDVREELDIQFKLLLSTELQAELLDLEQNFLETFKKSTADSQRQQLPFTEIEKRFKKQLTLIQMIDIEDQQLHKVRLKIKRLHYQIAYFYPQKKRWLKRCQFLQQELGAFHDTCQAIKLLKNNASKLEKKLWQSLKHFLEKRKNAQLQHLRNQLNENTLFS